MFDITDIKIRLVNADSKLKAVASIVIDDCIAIHDIKILSGEGGDFIAMPSRKTPDGTYRDIIHPINSETREIIKNAIFAKYQQVKEDEELS